MIYSVQENCTVEEKSWRKIGLPCQRCKFLVQVDLHIYTSVLFKFLGVVSGASGIVFPP